MNATIAVLPGDGIGPEVTSQAVRVLERIAARHGHALSMRPGHVGGIAIDETGTALPDATVALCREADAVLLGAVGGPKWDDPLAKVRPEQGLLGLRKALGLYANLRPVKLFPSLLGASPLKPELLAGVDMVIVRELTGGIYFGEKKREPAVDGRPERASDLCVYDEGEIARVVRAAADLACRRRGKLTSVDKANVLETSRLWRRVTERVVRDEFVGLELEHILVDSCAMHLIRRPADFDVIVTENMFGDILSDEASMLAGSMGMLASASLGDPSGPADADSTDAPRTRGLYEPIHGSAPDIAGQGVANPYAAILSAALLLRLSLGLSTEAAAVEAAVSAAIDRGVLTADVAPRGSRAASTAEAGDAVLAALA